jgi:AcrR family transcriptional regulator
MVGKQSFAGKPPRRRDKKAKIERIIEATRRLIEQNGYMGTNTNKIADAAGVSVGLVYKYFPDGKCDIAYEISLRYHSAIVDAIPLINMAEITEHGFRDRLIHILLNWIEQHRKNIQFIRAMDLAMLMHPFLFKGYADIVRKSAEKGQLLLWPKETSGIRTTELKKLTLTLFHTIESVVHRHITSIEVCETDKQLAEFLADVVLGVMSSRLDGLQSPLK